MKKNYLNCSLRIIALTAIMLFMIACKDTEVDTSQYYLDAPTEVVATKVTSSQIHLTWNEVANAKSYEISFRKDIDNETTRLPLSTPTITSYIYSYSASTFPQNVTILYFYVKANPRVSGYIASGWSNPAPVNIRE